MSGTMKEHALLCVDDPVIQQKMGKALESLGFHGIISTSTEKTMEQIKGTPYRVIILEDDFQGMPLGNSPIYLELAQMSMSLRRYTFLVLLAKGAKHLDPMEAFSLSANLLLDKDRVKGEEGLKDILLREISQYAKFYLVYEKAKEQISQGK
jgi:hypothetical protein